MATTSLGIAQAVTPLGGGGNGEVLSTYKITGTFVGTLTFEATFDGGVTYDPIAATPLAGGADVTTATAVGVFRAKSSGADGMRARMSAYTSGAAIVKDSHSNGTL